MDKITKPVKPEEDKFIFTEGIDYFTEYPEKCFEQVQEGKDYIRENHSWKAVGLEWEAVLKDIHEYGKEAAKEEDPKTENP